MTEKEKIETLKRQVQTAIKYLDSAETTAIKETQLADELGEVLTLIVDEFGFHLNTRLLQYAEQTIAKWKQERYWNQ